MAADKITKAKVLKYLDVSSRAFEIAKENIAKKHKESAEQIILMVDCYISDAKHFMKKEDLVNAFACLNYAHGWLDCGARLKIFNVTDNNLFTV